jgi:formiminoglutamase
VEREQQFHREYHRALQAEVERVKALHGEVVLYDCHSIRSEVPFLFDDVLPVLNVGNNLNQTCSKSITMAIEEICQRNKRHSYVINGRFRGGWTTRHYGKPDNGVHAIQMELAQRAYLKTEYPPFELDRDKATSLRTVLSDILGAIEKTVTKQQST